MSTALPARRRRSVSAVLINLVLNTFTFVAFILAMQPRGTGIPVHEWGSVLLGVAIVGHLVLHWEWIVGISRKLAGPLPLETRLNYLLNLAFFVDMTLIIFSGLMISRAVLPALGLSVDEHTGPWRRLHGLSADAGVVILALHVAMHRKWIVQALRKYVWGRVVRPARVGR
ncbi:DUF4405 domain-containing protein [Deinococcus pimensis]|uniref:DUF4405 domain-containing protein n=1 Tax=Deinococcus pimensis TaxID=309888 RepID=UPI0004B57E2C|nr:DUF4405 domain-containing protein [Deinococcus pimensis]